MEKHPSPKGGLFDKKSIGLFDVQPKVVEKEYASRDSIKSGQSQVSNLSNLSGITGKSAKSAATNNSKFSKISKVSNLF